MPDIGATLREARMRARTDISEVEAETKIRAKYLRALENEEWDLLPGPTYVKSFLRTYAEALGLDGRLLVEEYKLRHERLSDVELQPIAPRSASDRRRPRGPGFPRGALVAVVVAGLLVALYLLGSGGGNDSPPLPSPAATTSTSSTAGGSGTAGGKPKQSGAGTASPSPAKRTVALRIVPTGPVYVCLEAAGGRRPVAGVILQAGSRQPTYRSSRFRLTLGNGEARLLVDGRTRTVPAVTNGIGYEITPKGRKVLPPGSRPRCT
jgi:cytoskeleton protein RodZ